MIYTTLKLKIFKTINNINPNYVKYVFYPKIEARLRLNDILVKSHKIINYGEKSLIVLGPKIWNQLPQKIKSAICFYKINGIC